MCIIITFNFLINWNFIKLVIYLIIALLSLQFLIILLIWAYYLLFSNFKINFLDFLYFRGHFSTCLDHMLVFIEYHHAHVYTSNLILAMLRLCFITHLSFLFLLMFRYQIFFIYVYWYIVPILQFLMISYGYLK